MSDHDVGGHSYVIGKLNVRQQAEIVTRLGFMTMALSREVTENHVDGARFIGSIVADDWKALQQTDRDMIMNTALSVVRTHRSGKLVFAFNPQTGLPQFEDMDIQMDQMFELVDLSLQENLGPFFGRLRADVRSLIEDSKTENQHDTNQLEC